VEGRAASDQLKQGKKLAKRMARGRQALAKSREATLPLNYEGLVTAITQAHDYAQRQAVQAVNVALTLRNWLVGYHIVEYEQHGSDRAQSGERLLENLTQDLRRRLGRGFGWRNLEMFRRFYLRYRISQSLIAKFDLSLPSPPSVSLASLDWQNDAYFARLFYELPWTHFIELVRMDDPLKRAFYEVETLRNRWSVRELKRQIDSLLYERVGLSRDKEGVLALAKEGELVATPAEMVRDPYVFEFPRAEARRTLHRVTIGESAARSFARVSAGDGQRLLFRRPPAAHDLRQRALLHRPAALQSAVEVSGRD
jgi:hypothetical protein